MLLNIRSLIKDDYEAVRRIYQEGIATGVATFETTAPDWSGFDEKYHPHSRFVILSENKVILGWAALYPVSKRHVYRGVAELSIYIAASARGRGIGDRLLKRLIESSEQHKIWTLQANIFSENEASIRLHQNNGFRVVGFREKIAQLNNSWKNNVLLERRSIQIL